MRKEVGLCLLIALMGGGGTLALVSLLNGSMATAQQLGRDDAEQERIYFNNSRACVDREAVAFTNDVIRSERDRSKRRIGALVLCAKLFPGTIELKDILTEMNRWIQLEGTE